MSGIHVVGVDGNPVVAIGNGIEVDRNAVASGGNAIGTDAAPASHGHATIDGGLGRVAGASISSVAETAAAAARQPKVMLESVRTE